MSELTIKIIIAVIMILLGIVGFTIEIKEYKRNSRDALLREFMDLFSGGGLAFIFYLIMILAGGGWLFYLLKCALWGKC